MSTNEIKSFPGWMLKDTGLELLERCVSLILKERDKNIELCRVQKWHTLGL